MRRGLLYIALLLLSTEALAQIPGARQAPPRYDFGFRVGSGAERSVGFGADSTANADTLAALLQAGGRMALRLEQRVTFEVEETDTTRLASGDTLLIYSQTGRGHIQVYPDFQPYGYSLLYMEPGAAFTLQKTTATVQAYPMLVDTITASVTDASAAITSGARFDCGRHVAGTRVLIDDGTGTNAHTSTIASCDSDSQITLDDAVSGLTGDYLTALRLGEDDRAYLIANGAYWHIDSAEASLVRCETGPASPASPGTVTVTGSRVIGKGNQPLYSESGRCSFIITDSRLTAHDSAIGSFVSTGDLGTHPHITCTRSQIVDPVYQPVGGKPDPSGHGLYVHPGVDIDFTDCLFQGSEGTAWKHYGQDASHDSAATSIQRSGVFRQNDEGFQASAIGTHECHDCAFTSTRIAAHHNLYLLRGSSDSRVTWISGNFGAARNLAGERFFQADTTTFTLDGPLLVFAGGYDATGQSFRATFRGSMITADQTGAPESLVSGDSQADGGETIEFIGGALTCTRCKNLITLASDQTIVLDDGVTLSGEPEDGCWIDNSAGGTVTNTDSNVTSTAPLLCP